MRSLLVVAQMSLALVLLVGSGLLIRSFLRLIDVDPGFDPRNLLTFQVGLPPTKYPKDEAQMVFFRDLLMRVGSLPGVRSVSMENFPPLTGMGSATGVHIIGEPNVAKRTFRFPGSASLVQIISGRWKFRCRPAARSMSASRPKHPTSS